MSRGQPCLHWNQLLCLLMVICRMLSGLLKPNKRYVLTGIKLARVDCISSVLQISLFGVYLPTAFIHLSIAQYSSSSLFGVCFLCCSSLRPSPTAPLFFFLLSLPLPVSVIFLCGIQVLVHYSTALLVVLVLVFLFFPAEVTS